MLTLTIKNTFLTVIYPNKNYWSNVSGVKAMRITSDMKGSRTEIDLDANSSWMIPYGESVIVKTDTVIENVAKQIHLIQHVLNGNIYFVHFDLVDDQVLALFDNEKILASDSTLFDVTSYEPFKMKFIGANTNYFSGIHSELAVDVLELDHPINHYPICRWIKIQKASGPFSVPSECGLEMPSQYLELLLNPPNLVCLDSNTTQNMVTLLEGLGVKRFCPDRDHSLVFSVDSKII
jgi:hypothetical protein